jgi:hypothetical protein
MNPTDCKTFKNLSPALDILYKAEAARTEGYRRVCELLLLDPTSTIARLLVETENKFGQQPLIKLVEEVSQIIGKHRTQRIITDWPFENFWGNPNEPKHSSLLKYFIDPRENHGCGLFLLRGLLSACNTINQELPIDEACEVTREDEHIDLLVTRNRTDGKYSIIFENKINWAPDQDNQLQRYVEVIHHRGFDYPQIYVFYLPLTSGKHPEPSDQAAIQKYGVKYTHITFETHILKWLDKVIEINSDPECPKAMLEGMRENLSHYRSLIKYLNQKQKEREMNAKILKRLEQAEKENPLPTWSQVESLQKSAVELKECLESVLRGKLLLRIQSLLNEKKMDAKFYSYDGTAEKQTLDSPYDERFDAECNLGIRVSDAVLVCFGGYPEKLSGEIFWTGYMKNGSNSEQETHKDIIIKEAERHLKDTKNTNSPWYVWDWNKEIDYDNCLEESTAERLASKLVDMCNSLANLL